MSNYVRYVKRQRLTNAYETDARKRRLDKQVRERAKALTSFKQQLRRAVAQGRAAVAKTTSPRRSAQG